MAAGGSTFGQRQPPLYVSIQKILAKYPDGQIFKEIIQNADDAGATAVHFYLDNRHHGTDSLVEPELSKFQGPALLAYNNAVFTDDDWQSIQDLQQSVKTKDPFKVGKFGIGFNSVYHITDLPTIMSGSKLAYLEPHEEIWNKQTGQQYDIQQQADKLDTFAPFNGLHGYHHGTDGTFFRFPLRSISREKRVSSHEYTIDKLREILTALREEARVILLFLRSVRVVEVHEISEGGNCSDLLRVSSVFESSQLQLRSRFYHNLKATFNKVSYKIVRPIECTINFKVQVEDFIDPQNNSESEWLVASRVGSQNHRVHCVAETLKALPWVGVALETTESSAIGGRVFCVLPMPSEVSCHLPVHVNATFSLNDERRELKWSGIERKNDPSADWNNLIIQHLLPPCYAGLLLNHAKHYLTGDAFYRAWPEVEKLRSTHWEGLLEPLLKQIFSEPVFWSHNRSWVAYSNSLFIPRDGQVPPVVTAVLSGYGENIVAIPPNLWDAICYCRVLVKSINPQVVRGKLKQDESVYHNYGSNQKLELLQYCLSDRAFRDMLGICLLPLANNTFTVFRKRLVVQPAYLCSPDYPCRIIPGCKNQLVDISDTSELYNSLVSLAENEVTQLEMLDTSHVAELLKTCLPRASLVTLPHYPISIEWLELFWGWAARQPNRDLFSGLPVVPGYDPVTGNTCAVGLSLDSPAIFSENFIRDDLLNVLGKLSVKCCERSRYHFLCTLSGSLINQFSPNGVLDAIHFANRYRNVVLTTEEAASLRSFLYSFSKNPQRVSTLKELAIFTTLSNSYKQLYSVNQAPFATIEPEVFPLSPHNLPPRLILFSGSEHEQLALLRSLSVWRPHSVDLLVDYIFPLIDNSRNCVDLMREVLVNIHSILSNADGSQKIKLKSRMESLSFLPANKNNYVDLHKPTTLYNPSDPLLQRLFKGKLVFPVEPFNSEKCLAVLKYCGLKTAVSPQEVVQVIQEIIALGGEGIRSVDATTYTRAKAVLECIAKWSESELSQIVTVYSKRLKFSHLLVRLSEIKSWLPVKSAPTEGYPETLSWKGKGQSQHLVSYGESTIVCSNNALLELACGSEMYFVDHSLPMEICQLFFPRDPDNLVKHVIAHLSTIDSSSHLSPREKLVVTHAVYQTLNEHTQQTIRNRASLPTECIYISRLNIFVSPSVVALQQNSSFRQNLEPFIYTLPDDLYPFASLFESLGVETHISQQQIVGILAQIKEGNPKLDSKAAWELVMTILNWLTGNGEHPVDVSDCGCLYVPIVDPSSTDWPTLVESDGVVYTDNDFLRRYIGASAGESYQLVNKRISPQMAQLLHLTPLSEYLDIAEDAFEDTGQYEPLTVRLKNILKNYKDGLTIIKELLQNADDAGATEVNICYDARNHRVNAGSLLFPGMASCHGPALVVHNNAVFTQDDFQNITKLAGATKEGKALKIGKFGVGFCSVYHMTDVPSFISGKYLYIFDPTLACLKDDIKNPAKPGKKVTHSTSIIIKSQQLAPYQGLFGFQKGHQYEGTMFRFPFRTAASELSSNIYTSGTVEQMFDGIQDKSSELLLFLQSVKCVKVHEISDSQQSPQIKMEITKTSEVSGSVTIVKVSCSPGDTRYWVVATHRETILRQVATASVACSLGVPTPYTPQSVEGEVFCFLPLAVKTGLPVHISSNFAVTNNRTGLWTSDDHSTNIREVQWNQSLVKTVIPKAYCGMLLCLKQMSLSSQLKEYLFYMFWPLRDSLTIQNPWNLMINTIYQQIQQSQLFFSNTAEEWLPLSKARFLCPGILSCDPNLIPTSVSHVASSLNMPIIDLPQRFHSNLNITSCMINEEEFLWLFFGKIECIDVKNRNQVLCLALECYAIELDKDSKRKLNLYSCLKAHACIPCTPDGSKLRKCCEVINPSAEFAGLFEEGEGLFPIKSFHEKQLVSKAMEILGIISSHISMGMLKERARTVYSLYKENKDKALKRTRLILNCLGSYNMQYDVDLEIARIPFLPVMPKPDGYFLSWFGDSNDLFSGEQLMLKGETTFLGNETRNIYVAGSQVPFTNELQLNKGGCGYLNSRARQFLKVREEPTLKEVTDHFKHVIQVFISDTIHSLEMIKEIDANVHSIYKYFEGVLRNLTPAALENNTQDPQCRSDISAVSALPCIWKGRKFIGCERVAKEWKADTGPYLYRVPDGYYPHLWNALGIKDKFTANDLITALKEIADSYGFGQVPLSVLSDILSELRIFTDLETNPAIMLPGEDLVMHTASSLSFNDAQWLQPDTNIKYVNHKLVTRDLAKQLGVKMVRSNVLEEHRVNPKPVRLKGEVFGQQEKLTTRIQGILQDYPFDVTVLKELLQNADDAKATKMYVILDERTHKGKRVLFEHWQDIQGPALLVWNDSVFSESDMGGIQKLGIGNKKSSAEKIGQYGIGFNSVYHLTDCPSFITADSLCILDPHLRYTSNSSVEFPGEKFYLTERFWSHFPDMKPAYLQSHLNGPSECVEIRNGSLFRFPLRHTQELVDASEIVDTRLENFENVVNANKMHDYLRSWAPQMKQSMFFLNHVTELKFFIISDSDDTLKLENHYQVKVDSSAVAKRSELHKRLISFNVAQGAEPFVTKYQLTLIDRDGGKEVKEKWLIQQGVGDIYNKEQKWKFIYRVKPRHGIAVPLQPPTDPHTFRGRVFCFLPLPLYCNLPVHINGHFMLHSSRRALWKTTDKDDIDSKQQWNKALIEAIASSYAHLLLIIKEDYSILNGEVYLQNVKKYYNTFPSWSAPTAKSISEQSGTPTSPNNPEYTVSAPGKTRAPTIGSATRVEQSQPIISRLSSQELESTSSHTSNTHVQLPTNEWLKLAEHVFRTLSTKNAPVIAVTSKSKTKTEIRAIEWCPLHHEDPALQVYFVGHSSKNPSALIKRIGMKLTNTKHWVRKHFEHVSCSIPVATSKSVYEYYAMFHQKVLPLSETFPCPIQQTSFKSVANFKEFFEYILTAIPPETQQVPSEEGGEEEETLTSVEYPPLIVTADGMLRYCNQECDKVIVSSFSAVFQKCLHHFLHPNLMEVKIPKHFLLTSSQENKDACIGIIDRCLTSTLPDHLLNVAETYCSEATVPLIENIWKCFKEDSIFKVFLKNILQKWAILMANNGRLYSCFQNEKAVLPILPLTHQSSDNENDNVNDQISLEVCKMASSVCQQLDLPFLDEIVPPKAVANICPTLIEPAFLLRNLYNFHTKFNISKHITKDVAQKLFAYFGNIHLKINKESLGYLMQLPLFQTHQGKFTSLSGKEVYQWPNGMCSDGEEIWLDECVVFLDPEGSWSELELHNELGVTILHQTEIYCQFVFPNFGHMNECIRYKHLHHIVDSVFEDARTQSMIEISDKRVSCITFINDLKCLPCIGHSHTLKPIHEFYDRENRIFCTFKEKFRFLPDYFTQYCENRRWTNFLEELGFHFTIKPTEFLNLCEEMASTQHTHKTREKSSVLFKHLFERDTQEWFSDSMFLSKVVNIPFVVADECKEYTWINRTPPEKYASGTRIVQTSEGQSVYLTQLNGACIYDYAKLVWSVKPVYRVPQQNMNPTNVLFRLEINFRATVSDVVCNLITISETGRANPKLFETYTLPFPSLHDIRLIDVYAKCFEFLQKNRIREADIATLKVTACIPVPASGDDRKRMVLVKPSQALTADSAKNFFPYLHRVPNELMASCVLLNRIGVDDSIKLSHIQLVLSTVHNQLNGAVIDPNTRDTICLAISYLCLLLPTSSGKDLSPLYLPGHDNCLHDTSKLVYPDSYSYKDCKLPQSTNFVLFHHPNPQKDQYDFANRFCPQLPEKVRPKPLSQLCCQQIILLKIAPESEDIEMAKCLKIALMLEQLPNVCISAFKTYTKDCVRMENIKELLSSFFQRVNVVTVNDLEVELAMKSSSSVIGTAKVEFYFNSNDGNKFCLYLDSKINRMVEEHIHKTMVQELLGAINNIVGKPTPGIVVPKIHEAFCLFLKAQTDKELHDACKISGIELQDADFVSPLHPEVGRPVPKEWHYMLDQNTDNIFHSQEIVGYEISEGNIIFAQVLYALPPEDLDYDQVSTNPLLTRYMIAIPDEKTVTALDIFKFVREPENTLTSVNAEEEGVGEEEQFTDATEAKRHLCKLLKEIWKMDESERSRAIRRLYLKWHPDKNLDNVELANEVFVFLKKQIERLEQGLDPEDIDEDEVDAMSPSSQWRERYRAWDETADSHTRHRSHHEQYFRSRPRWSGGASWSGGLGSGMSGASWPTPKPDVTEGQRWAQQAEYDLMAVEALYEKAVAGNNKLCSHVCFMAHEVAEKALKGGVYAVCGLNEVYLKDHQIYTLACMLRGERANLASELPSATLPLERYYLGTRFPNRCPSAYVPSDLFTIINAQEARENARKILTIVKSILPTMSC